MPFAEFAVKYFFPEKSKQQSRIQFNSILFLQLQIITGDRSWNMFGQVSSHMLLRVVIFSNLFERALHIILRSTLMRDIGRCLVGHSGSLPGCSWSLTLAEFTFGGSLPFSLISCNTLWNTDARIVFAKFCWKAVWTWSLTVGQTYQGFLQLTCCQQ